MAVCYGCGLRINGVDGSLEAATSEEWESGALAGFGSDSTSGAPVYCDANGQLRTVPEHTSDTFDAGASQGSTAIADGANVNGATTTIVVNNPSSIRAASIMGTVGVIEQMDWANGDPSFAPNLELTRNAVPFVQLTGLFTIAGDNATASSFWWTQEGSFVDAIAAGVTVTYVGSCSVDAGPGTAGNFVSRVAVRGLVVTA